LHAIFFSFLFNFSFLDRFKYYTVRRVEQVEAAEVEPAAEGGR